MLSPNLKKLERLAKVLDNGDIALLAELDTLEGRLEAVEGIVPELRGAKDGYTPEKGKDYTDGYTPVKGKDYFDGEDYVLTEKDKREIAKTITVPVVEKVIEKTIIKEVPIVTNEIVEVAVLDEATVAYLEDEIRRVEKAIPEMVKQKETNFGFVIRDVVAGIGVTIDKTDPNRPILSASGSSVNWTYYATTWSVEPTLNTSITGGDVYNYTLDGTTRYRFVPTVYDATEDAFYSTFVNPTLFDLIVTRG